MIQKLIIIFISYFMISSCGDSESTADDLGNQIVSLQAQQHENLVGFWTSENSEYSYEFFSSIVYGIATNNVKVGRVFKNDTLIHWFYWEIDEEGLINLNLANLSCIERPITLCNSVENIAILADGSDIENASWAVFKDNNLDGYPDSQYSAIYRRKQVQLPETLPNEFYLNHPDDYFSNPIIGTKKEASYELGIRISDSYASFVTEKKTNSTNKFVFTDVDKDLNIKTNTRNFYVENIGYMDINYRTWFENITLTSSNEGNYSLHYELYRELILPEGVDRELVDLDGFSLLIKRTRLVHLIDKFIKGPQIESSSTFYSLLREHFSDDISINGATNEINFETLGQGYLNFSDLNKGKFSQIKPFTWNQQDSGEINVVFEDNTQLDISFIRITHGGYTALIIRTDESGDKRYVIHDFLKEAPPADLSNILPGRFEFLSTIGIAKVFVDFNADNTISFSNAPDLGGYWFIDDATGELVSFECTDLAGYELTDYHSCLDSLDEVTKDTRYTNFSHIRRLKFFHQDNNDYQVKYDAVLWGDVFGIVAPEFLDYINVSWTYRWKRIGDVE